MQQFQRCENYLMGKHSHLNNILIALPVGTATAERSFSQMK